MKNTLKDYEVFSSAGILGEVTVDKRFGHSQGWNMQCTDISRGLGMI